VQKITPHGAAACSAPSESEGATDGAQHGSTDLREIRAELSGLRAEFRRFVEHANQQHVDTVLGDLKRDYADLFASHQVDTARTDLSARMVADCAMREGCLRTFMEFLQSTAGHIRDGKVSDDLVRNYREQMSRMRKKGPFERCDTCFTEVRRLFEKQVDLMQSLGIYESAGERAEPAADVSEELIVRELVDPVANTQRLQILRALATRTRTFSELSRMTGLRGGNLLFHIKKLVDAGMILQRHERGDYIVTQKGFRTVNALSELGRTLMSQ